MTHRETGEGGDGDGGSVGACGGGGGRGSIGACGGGGGTVGAY